jgi:5-methylcytosine-specific restriction endonuclease McrA
MTDAGMVLWYNSNDHTANHKAGRFVLSGHRNPAYFAGKAPFTSIGLASPGWLCGNNSDVCGGRFAMEHSFKECVRCHKVKRYAGRGICSACYRYLSVHGGLDDYPRVLAEPNSKVPCSNCGESVKIYAYGLCKKCYSKLPERKEYHAKDMRERRKKDVEKYRAKERDRRERRSENRKIYHREYYDTNRESLCQYQVAWRKNNKEKYSNYMRAASARKRNAEGETTLEQWNLIVEYYCPNNLCPACGKEFDETKSTDKITADHVIPLSKGGTNYPDNIQPLCHSCNSSKSNERLTDYRWDGGEYMRSMMEKKND